MFWKRRAMKSNLRETNPRAEAGQALVELALTLPILLMILVGVAEFARFTYFAIEVSNAAHAGAQYGVQSNVTASDNSAIQLAATNDGSNLSGIVASPSHSCKCSDGTASTCLPTDCATSRIVEYVQVTTTATISPIFKYPGISRTITLTGQAVMRVEQ